MARTPLGFGSFVPLGAHSFLALFTLGLVVKLEERIQLSWWWIFAPLWMFHLATARCKCSMPAPNTPHDRQWSPMHGVVVLPLLLCFELLLCCYLAAKEERQRPPMSLEVVFLPLVLLQGLVLADNFRMCMVLMPGEDDNMTDEALWETLPHFAVAVSMVFFVAATIFSILKLSGHVDVLDWWDLLVNFCIGEFFAFLLCVKWVNPHASSRPSSSTSAASPLLRDSSAQSAEGSSGDPSTGRSAGEEGTGGDSGPPADEEGAEFACGMPEVGGHFVKAGVVMFQVLLCMRLEGEPRWAASMSLWALFSPLLAMHGAALLSALLQLAEAALLSHGSDGATKLALLLTDHDPCSFLTRGMRLAGWWPLDDECRDERRALNSSLFPGYNTFEPAPPDHIRRMRKGELCEEVLRLQSALVEQAESSKTQRQELDRVQQEKVLCRVCFERDISLVLMPCRHRVLCNLCADKCKHCPICRRAIVERMAVFDV